MKHVPCNRLGFFKPLIETLTARARRNGTTIERELLHHAGIEESAYYAAKARLLRLPFVERLSGADLVDDGSLALDTQLCRPVTVRVDRRPEMPQVVVVPEARRLGHLACRPGWDNGPKPKRLLREMGLDLPDLPSDDWPHAVPPAASADRRVPGAGGDGLNGDACKCQPGTVLWLFVVDTINIFGSYLIFFAFGVSPCPNMSSVYSACDGWRCRFTGW